MTEYLTEVGGSIAQKEFFRPSLHCLIIVIPIKGNALFPLIKAIKCGPMLRILNCCKGGSIKSNPQKLKGSQLKV